MLTLESDCLRVIPTLPITNSLSVPVFPHQKKAVSCDNASTLASISVKTEGERVYGGLGIVLLLSLLFSLL